MERVDNVQVWSEIPELATRRGRETRTGRDRTGRDGTGRDGTGRDGTTVQRVDATASREYLIQHID